MNHPGAEVDGGAARHTAAQQRVIAAAVRLFGQHGVSGTSLQMIADELGVTKAAVYHQFKTKNEIVLAVAEVEMTRLAAAVEAAEAAGGDDKARLELLELVIDLAIGRRRMAGLFQNDPVMQQFVAEHEPFRRSMMRLFTVLVGGDESDEGRVAAATLSAAIGGAIAHPGARDVDDATFRAQLAVLARRLIGLPVDDER